MLFGDAFSLDDWSSLCGHIWTGLNNTRLFNVLENYFSRDLILKRSKCISLCFLCNAFLFKHASLPLKVQISLWKCQTECTIYFFESDTICSKCMYLSTVHIKHGFNTNVKVKICIQTFKHVLHTKHQTFVPDLTHCIYFETQNCTNLKPYVFIGLYKALTTKSF